MPYRRDVVLSFASLAFAAAALRSIVVRAEVEQRQPTAAASSSAGGGGALGLFPPPWAKATAAVSSVTASAACSLFGRESSVAARDSRLGLATAAACDVATNLELWLQPLLGGAGASPKGGKWLLPPGATPLSSPAPSDALAADRAAVASAAAATASTTSSSSSASSSATSNARPVCAAASLFPGTGSGLRDTAGGSNRALLPVCQAPSLEVVADGGRCSVESEPPHAVVCVSPSVTLEITPPRCSLGYYDDDDDDSVSIPPPSRSLVVDSHCGPPLSSATGGERVFLGGKLVPAAAPLNGSGAPPPSSLAEYDRAASAVSSWPDGWGGAPLADAKSLAELLAAALLPGKVTATASVGEG